jgi:hypothetical protein
MYLQIPIHYAYKVDVTPGMRVVLHGGPYVAYGIGGSVKANFAWIEESDNKPFSKDGVYKPFDAGLGIGVGAEFGAILVGLGWDMGLVDIARNIEGSVRNQNAYLTVGYRF